MIDEYLPPVPGLPNYLADAVRRAQLHRLAQVDDLQLVVCAAFGILRADLLAPRRGTPYVAAARVVSMGLCRDLLRLTHRNNAAAHNRLSPDTPRHALRHCAASPYYNSLLRDTRRLLVPAPAPQPTNHD